MAKTHTYVEHALREQARKPRARLTIAEIRTNEAADALVALYGQSNAGYVAQCFAAGWLTDAERKAFAPLVAALEARALGDAS